MSASLDCSPAVDLPLDDLVLEVFLRLPPEPHHLLAASLVCRRWCRLVRNPAFLRRFRALHGAPPVLGFFKNIWCVTRRSNLHSRRLLFTPVAPFLETFIPPNPGHWALDCRRGRVLLHGSSEQGLLVWDPMAGNAHHVSMPPGLQGLDVAATLVCAVGHDDHTDCRSIPFQIVFLDSRVDGEDQDSDSRLISAHVYSSGTSTWGDATTIMTPFAIDNEVASTLVGSSVYWNLELTTLGSNYILEFEMSGHRLALIELPPGVCQAYMSDIRVMLAEDGGLGFVGVNQYNLHFWSRKIVPEGAAEWVLIRRIDLNNLTTMSGLPAGDLLWSSVVAFAEDGDELFLQSEAGIFVIGIRSLQLRKVFDATGVPIYPYASFYTRGRNIMGIYHRGDQ